MEIDSEQLHKVKVMTFKPSGKYYDEFDVYVKAKSSWYYVSEAVKTYKERPDTPQQCWNWLIGISEEGLCSEVTNGIYPMIIMSKNN